MKELTNAEETLPITIPWLEDNAYGVSIKGYIAC